VRVDRTRRGMRRLRREHNALDEIAGIPQLSGTVPRNVAVFEHGDTLVLAQSALGGCTLAVDLRRRFRPTARRIRMDHDRVLMWLDHLQSSQALEAARRNGASPKRLVDPDEIVELAGRVLPPDTAWARSVIRRLAAMGTDLGMIEVPLARGHGDLGPSNILIAPGDRRDVAGRIAVVDWEGASAQASVLNDVMMFLHHYARATPTPRHGLMARDEVAAEVFLGDGVLARETWRRWCDVLDRHRLPREAARYLLFALVVAFATNATEYAHRDRPSPMWTEIARRYAREWARQGFPEGAATPR
jgi:hypothetical protein